MKISIKNMILVSMFTTLTVVGAFIKIPLGTISITLQFLFTALAGIVLGSRLGALSQLIYVTLGLIGIPVFTKGGGFSYIFEPSFGYLIGFILGAYVIGKIAESSQEITLFQRLKLKYLHGINKLSPNYLYFFKIFIASAIGLAVTYIIGVPYLYIILKNVNNMQITFHGALQTGLLLFLPGDFIKCLITAAISVKVVPILKKQLLLK